jgi:hypothetical protein
MYNAIYYQRGAHMKKYILLLGLIISLTVQASDKATVWGNSVLVNFINYTGLDVDTRIKIGADGDFAYNEALSDSNGFFVLSTPAKRFYESGINNPFDTMDYVATLGTGTAAYAVKLNSPFNTLEDVVENAKKTKKPIKLGGSGNALILGAGIIESTFKVQVDAVDYKTGVQHLADLTSDNLDVVVLYPYNMGFASPTNPNRSLKLVGSLCNTNLDILKGVKNYNPTGGYSLVLFANKKMNSAIKQRVVEALESKQYADNIEKTRNSTYTSLSTTINKKELLDRIETEKQIFNFKLKVNK